MSNLFYATREIEDFMNLPESLPFYAGQARNHIIAINRQYAPSVVYNPKTFDHFIELKVRLLFHDQIAHGLLAVEG